MSQDLYELIKEKYPLLVSDDMRQPFNAFGVECDKGWHPIILAVLDNIYNKYKSSENRVALFKQRISEKKYDDFFTEERVADVLAKAEKDFKECLETLPKIEQIKEKFGSLRIYLSQTNDYIDGLVNLAETLSAITCERCGDKGKIYTIGWHKALCPVHAQVRYWHGENNNLQ